MARVEYGTDRLIRGTAGTDGSYPPGWATLILGAGASIDKLDLWVTGYSDVQHELMSQVGQEPIEDGSRITDHVVAMPTKVSMIGYVSDISVGPDAAADSWERIRELHRNKEILRVITEYGVYDEMVIRTADTTATTRGLQFNIQLQQIVRVGVGRSEVISVPASDNNPAAQRNEEVPGGPKTMRVAAEELGDGRLVAVEPGTGRRVEVEPARDKDGNIIVDENGIEQYITIGPAPVEE